MASNPFAFIIPESLRVKKATNSPLSKPATTTGGARMRTYSPPRHTTYQDNKAYRDLDEPRGLSSPTSSRSPQPLFKRTIMTRSGAHGRHSVVARAARVARRRSSSQLSSSSATDLRSVGSAMKHSLFADTSIEKRLKASRRGTVRSGVDNRFGNSVRKTDQRPRSRTRETVTAEENVTKTERHIEGTKVESITDKIVLPKGAVARHLKRMIGRICENDFDKYQILDERDKLMQRGRLKTTDVESATAVQGTCPDMCPEKERYMRVVQKRVSGYECRDDGQMAPELTVKEYSRSAADQEEPLPHELRPADVLRRTMNYLVGKIASDVPETDEELAQWYDFLWNRTRAIRKDITQQIMVNDTAVSLIEQCVRLHIFASHRLCELDFNEFDQKMNTENLSKSLQSLRYLYDDLAKKGVFYSSEAEFRAYEIMLNLSDSNIFRQALTYRREILESGSVRLAVQLFTCLQNQNYVRFFRLLKNDATYLQCCLCHRYFNRMRHQAIYNISHSVHITGKYPVSKFIQLLGFDDRDAALQFLDCYNVRRTSDLDTGEELMLMSKTRLIEPIEEPPPKIQSWIETKRNGHSITEVLSGGRDVEVEIRTPLHSFDKNGAYIFDTVLNNYITESENEQLAMNDEEPVTFTFSLPAQRKEIDAAEKLADELISEEVTRICMLIYGKSVAHSLTTELYDGILEDCLKPCCQEVLMAAKLLHRRKLASEAEKQHHNEIRSLHNSLSNSLLHDVIDRIVRDIGQKWIMKYHRIHNEELLEDIGKSFLDDLITQMVSETVRKVGKKKIEEGVSFMKQRLKEINERLDKLWLKQFVDRWREHVSYRKEEERKRIELLSAFPVILPAKSELVFRRRDGNPFERGFIDCSSLPFEQKLNAFIEKRHEKIARKVLAKWKSWTDLQIERREFFTRQKRHRNNNNIPTENEDEVRLAVAFAEMETELLKPFLSSWQIHNDLEEERNLSWYESLDERSSALLGYTDQKTLEKGVEMARRNLERIYGTQMQVKDENDAEWSGSLDNLSCSLNRRNEIEVKIEEDCPPTKKKCKSLEKLIERVENFTKKLDDTFKDIDEQNQRYDEILSSFGTDT